MTAVHYDGSGTVTFGAGTITVDCAGSGDFWGTSDSGSIEYESFIGTEMETEVTSAVAGAHTRLVMLRSSADANAAFYCAILDGDRSHLTTVWRDTPGGVADWAGEDTGVAYNSGLPLRIRMRYEGGVATAYVSQNDGESWTQVGTRSVASLSLFCVVNGGGGGQTAVTFTDPVESNRTIPYDLAAETDEALAFVGFLIPPTEGFEVAYGDMGYGKNRKRRRHTTGQGRAWK